jgi:hypothetical protein
MRIKGVSSRWSPFVVVVADRSAMAVQLNSGMSPSSTGSSTMDPSLLSPPTNTPVSPSIFYSCLIRNRPVTPPQNVSIPTSTPISNKTSGNHSYASETHDRESANYRLAQETSGLFLGAMPPNQFLDTFLPIPLNAQQYPESVGNFENVLDTSKEVNMYTPFVRVVFGFISEILH